MIITFGKEAEKHYERLQGRGKQYGEDLTHTGFRRADPAIALRNLKIKDAYRRGWSKGRIANHFSLGRGTITQILRASRIYNRELVVQPLYA